MFLAYNNTDGVVDLSALERVWAQILNKANARIAAYGREQGSRLGSTFSGLFICQGRVFTGQVGDSRVYRLRDGELELLTRDQTLVEREVETGLLTPEEAEHHPKRSVILQAVGSQAELKPVFASYDLAEGDIYAVCCDGFYHTLSKPGIARLLGGLAFADESEMAAILEASLQERMDLGERDNITVACCVCGEQLERGLSDEATTVLAEDEATEVLSAGDAATGAAPAPATAPAPAAEPESTPAPEPAPVTEESPCDDATSLLEAEDAPTGELAQEANSAAAEPGPGAAGPEEPKADDGTTRVLDAADDGATTVLGEDAPAEVLLGAAPSDAPTTVLQGDGADTGATGDPDDDATTVLGGDARC